LILIMYEDFFSGRQKYLFSNPCSVPVLVTLEEVLLHAITCRNDSGPFISDTIKRSIKHILSASYRRSGTRSWLLLHNLTNPMVFLTARNAPTVFLACLRFLV